MRRYIKSLDGIRGFGIFFVLCYHYLRLTDANGTVLGFSWIWIQMFFVQSGYLITQILLDSKHKSLAEYAGDFYWKRILRIFPVYFSYLLVFTLAYFLFNMPDDFGDRAPYLFTFTYNYTRLMPDIDYNSVWFIHFWSLAVEEQFYLVWPMIIFLLNIKQLRVLLVIIALLAPVFRYWLGNYVLESGFTADMTGEIVYAFTLGQFDAFAFGAAIPIFSLDKSVKRPGMWSLVAALAVIGIGLANYFITSSVNPDIHISSLGISVAHIENLQHVWSYTLINCLFLLVILYLISEKYRGIFNNESLVKIGKIVYGIYIFHFGILFLVSKINSRYIHSFGLSFVLGFALTYAVAHLSYYYFEKRFLGYKDLWKKRKSLLKDRSSN